MTKMLLFAKHGSRTNANTKEHAKDTTQLIADIFKKDHANVDNTANGVTIQKEMNPRHMLSLNQMLTPKQKQTSEPKKHSKRGPLS